MTHVLRRLFALLPLALIGVGCTDDSSAPEVPDDPDASVTAASLCVPAALDEILIGLIQGMQVEVDALAADGILNGGQENGLERHLTNALRQLERGEYCAFNDQVTAFRDQLEELVGELDISDRDAFESRYQARMALGGPINPVGHEEHAPGARGEVKTLLIDGNEIVAEVIDGLAIVGGDIILGFEDELTGGTVVQTALDGPLPTGPCSGDGLICGRWSDQTIGYDYQTSWGTDSDRMASLIEQAIDHWEEETGMQFERRSTGERIVFRNGTGCSSWIGRNLFAIFDPQYVFLHPTMCDDKGVIAHEIGHAVGLYHEQARNDRDDWVDVNFDAIEDDREFNFLKYLANGNDIGSYDYGSLMHYACDLFHDGVSPKPSLEPIRGGVTCDDLGQRDALSPKDVLGAYWLYRPEWKIGGAEPFETRDRFVFSLEWETEPMADEFIKWWVGGRYVATGQTLSTVDHGIVGDGRRIVTEIFVEGVYLGSREIFVNIRNDAPVVTLGPDRTVDLNRTFRAFPEVSDTEDGTCPATVCSYEWDPEPTSVSGATADYFFDATGLQTITVTVTDGFGDSASDEMLVTVVNSPPAPTIESPSSPSTFSSGSVVGFSGSATDANVGPGPGPGTLPCSTSSMAWSSSDPTDVVNVLDGCIGTITFGDPGPRTLSFTVEDPEGNSASTSAAVTVDGCGATGCAPDVTFDFDTPPELDGSAYDPPFTAPGYLIDTEIQATAGISDPDGRTSVSYEWKVRPPCFGGCDAFVVDSGGLITPNNASLSWTPSADSRVTDYWPTCTTTALPFVISLHATDPNGNTRVYSRTVYLACDLI